MMILALPPRLDLIEATPLTAAFRQAFGKPLTVDASGVEHLGALCLQVLIAAARHWREEGVSFAITPRSDAFVTALNNFGLDVETVTLEEV